MERALKVMTLDIKKKKFISSLIIPLLGMLLVSILGYYLLRSIEQADKRIISETMLRLIPYIILVIGSFSLTQEFSNKTDKIIFSGIFSRNEIMISKLMSFIAASVICFVFYQFAVVMSGYFDLKHLFIGLLVFLIYSFTMGTFILLVSVLTSNFIVTGIITYILYFDLILVLFSQALVSGRNEMLKLTIQRLPFYIANVGFYNGSYSWQQAITMILYGMLFFGIACVIINRKNI